MDEKQSDPCSAVSSVTDVRDATAELDVLIVAAGFEERAFKVLSEGNFRPNAFCILVRFRNDVPGNKALFRQFLTRAKEQFPESFIKIVELSQDAPEQFEAELQAALKSLPREVSRVGIDISGMPSYAVCLTLKAARDHRADASQLVLYTAAKEYTPSKSEYERLVKESPGEIEYIPESMSLEMDELLVLDAFSGYRSQKAQSCLAIFAGYEAHRSNGVVEAINPALLLLIYGKPADKKLLWRLDMSKRLHRKFEKSRKTAAEVTSTLHVMESLEILEKYYNYLIDEYDLVLSPISSKMNVVATYLFWERYGEVQLTFPLPIGYDPNRRPRGVAKTYILELYPRRQFYRSSESF